MGHRDAQAHGGSALGVALKTVYPINMGLSQGNSWHFVGITYGREKGAGMGVCVVHLPQ